MSRGPQRAEIGCHLGGHVRVITGLGGWGQRPPVARARASAHVFALMLGLLSKASSLGRIQT